MKRLALLLVLLCGSSVHSQEKPHHLQPMDSGLPAQVKERKQPRVKPKKASDTQLILQRLDAIERRLRKLERPRLPDWNYRKDYDPVGDAKRAFPWGPFDDGTAPQTEEQKYHHVIPAGD